MSNQSLKNTKFFQENNGRFKKGHHWRPPQNFRNKKWLIENYINKKRSMGEIASEFNVTEAAIRFWMVRYKIPRRNVSEARKLKKWGLSGKKNGMYGKCGCENPRWIDGSSPIRQTMYARSFWKELAKSVYQRDEYKCVRCGVPHTGKNKLHAHHVKTWAGNIDARFEISNIITVCQKCHNWIHSRENINNEFLSP